MKHLIATITIALLVGACSGEHRAPRDLYNQGVAALAKGDFEGAEKALLDARSTAGVDPELQFRAAYDLGITYAAHADKVKQGDQPDLEKALELAQQAATWLSAAARERKDDVNVQQNLAIVRARIQAISDQLREGDGKLEVRLDKLIGEQRNLLDDARSAWLGIKTSGGADPLAQQAALSHLADRERGIVAEAGVITDIAADEIDAIGKKAEDKRSDDEKVRVVVLKNLDLYLLDARTRIADARRKLQELAAEEGVSKAEAALVALKRGREQLLDPITVLRSIAQDQVGVLRETMLAAGADGTLKLDQQLPTPSEMPAWLAPPAIGERQGGLRDRLEEVRGRVTAATSQPPAPTDPVAPQDPKAAERAKFLERMKLALPALTEASAAMDRAATSLRAGTSKPAIDDERAALAALAKAIEQFADLKQLIELAYQDQTQLVTLVSPVRPDGGPQLPAVERATETKRALESNVARMPHLQELLAEQVAQAEAAAKQPPDPKAPPGAPDAQKQQLEEAKQMLAHAEELRSEAAVSLGALGAALAANSDPLTPAKTGQAKLAELRKLFFSVIEHLQQLIRDQGDTRDQTTSVNAEDMFGREAKLPPLVTTQTQHGELAKALTDALAAQADAAAKQKQPQPGAPDAKALSGAAAEVRLADQDMADAIRDLTKARDDKQASHSLEPVTKAQGTAIEHLENALKLLQPPQQNKNQNKDPQQHDQQQQDPQEQKQKQKQDDQQQQQSGGAGQRVKDEDAKRQKARQQGGDPKDRRQQQQQSGTVEKDW